MRLILYGPTALAWWLTAALDPKRAEQPMTACFKAAA